MKKKQEVYWLRIYANRKSLIFELIDLGSLLVSSNIGKRLITYTFFNLLCVCLVLIEFYFLSLR